MDFEIVSEIAEIETIAGQGSSRPQSSSKVLWWYSLAQAKGVAQVRLANGTIRLAEVHWYEAHGVGKREFKLKLPFLD